MFPKHFSTGQQCLGPSRLWHGELLPCRLGEPNDTRDTGVATVGPPCQAEHLARLLLSPGNQPSFLGGWAQVCEALRLPPGWMGSREWETGPHLREPAIWPCPLSYSLSQVILTAPLVQGLAIELVVTVTLSPGGTTCGIGARAHLPPHGHANSLARSSQRDLPLEGHSGNPHLHPSQASLRNAGLGVPPVFVPIDMPESGLSKAGDQSGWERFQG